jgi:predicted RNA binding protein YcfA (HicA-like mRNA interferase family)
MSWPPQVWDQIKTITADELMAALERDGWQLRKGRGSRRVFRKGPRIVAIHYHRRKIFSPKMLRALLGDIGWDETDLRRLGLTG